MPNIPPGSSDLYSFEQKEIRAVLKKDILLGATLAATSQDLEIGTVLGMVTATKEYAPYDHAANDGREVARAILSHPVDASDSPQSVQVYVSGIFYTDRLVGLDDNAKIDLYAREPVPNILVLS